MDLKRYFRGPLLWILAFGATVSILVRTRLPWRRPSVAVLLAPVLFLSIVFTTALVLVNLGIVAP